MKLVVKHAFAGYQVGEQITDPTTVDAIVAGEHLHDVIKVGVTAQDVAAVTKLPKTK